MGGGGCVIMAAHHHPKFRKLSRQITQGRHHFGLSVMEAVQKREMRLRRAACLKRLPRQTRRAFSRR